MRTRWEVILIDGPDAGRRFMVPYDRPLLIGRGSDSDTKINVPQISRIHCHVTLVRGQPILEDHGSGLGTLFRDKLVTEPTKVTHGDEFFVGPLRLRVESNNPLDAETTKLSNGDGSMCATGGLSELIGQEFHGFLLEGIASQGTSGVIFKGREVSTQQLIAFKVLHPHLTADDAQRDRFVRAMRVTLPIRHPHIVRVLNAGRRGQYCWIAMEWVEGLSVRSLIDRIGTAGALDWEDVWRVGVHVARALEEAHRLHMIHRNISPSNILRRDSDRAYLLNDLCFAKALDETDARQLTRAGDILGELPYIAPERLINPAIADHRVDLYGLGATLYSLLTGRPPYVVQSVAELLDRIRTSEVAPIKFRRQGIFEPFELLVLRLLAKEPSKRLSTASDLTRELKEVGRRRSLEADASPWTD